MRWYGSGPQEVEPALVVVVSESDRAVVAQLRGTLDVTTVADVDAALRTLLLDRGRVVVDAGGLRVPRAVTLSVFPTVLAAVGGWPEARLVVEAPAGDVATGMRRTTCHHEVPLAADRAAALAALDRRPARVRRTATLPRGTESPVAVARALCALACADWGITEPDTTRALTVTAALVANAADHTDGPVDMRLVLDGAGLRVSITDRRPDLRPSAEPLPCSGLRVVEQQCDGWGYVTRRHDKTVWATFRVPGSGAVRR